MNSDHLAALQAIGLDESKIKELSKNQKITARLYDTIQKGGQPNLDKKTGNLIYKVATELPESVSDKKREVLAQYVANKKIDSNLKVDHAINYIKSLLADQELDINAFEKAAGVGVVYSQEQISQIIKDFFEIKKAELAELRYCVDQAAYMAQIREHHPFMDGAIFKKEFDALLLATLGPKTEQDKVQFEQMKKLKDKSGGAKKGQEPKQDKKKDEQKSEQQENNAEEEDQHNSLKKLVARDLAASINSEKLLAEHKKATGGKIMTRFPPEPNGYLHIGHAKAMRFNFMTAKENGGHCYLRMDDTNPEKENQEYIDSIVENVKWLGYEPYKLTFASDNFDKLYNFAIELIKKGKAYVCAQTKAEASESRTNKTPSPYRERPIEENLRLFEEMKLGLHAEGSYSLRLKIDYQHPNPTLRDPVAYRIRFTPHPHCGDKWCIYPCYDYTHCLCDSLENITHSLCTLEFEIRRELYYWTLEQCDVYRPFVWEYSRMNVSNYVVSKRKLQALVFGKHVTSWDDPRMPTVQGLRRKGYTPEAINEFCDILGVTRRGNENFVSYKLLESCIRKDLDRRAPRTMVVLEPVRVIIQDIEENQPVEISVPDFPKEPERGSHNLKLSRVIYVERSDVRMDDHKDHYGMSPNRVCGLKYAGLVTVNEVKGTIDANGQQHITEVLVTRLPDKSQKPKSHIHWVSQADAVPCEVRLYDVLFKSYDPNTAENFLDDLNPNSLEVKPNAVMSKQLTNLQIRDKVQFERLGFFSVDDDSKVSEQKYVFNRVVTLAESVEVKNIKENLKKN